MFKLFKIDDIFEKLPLKNKNNFNKTKDISINKTTEFDLPLVNAKHGDNGIMYYGRSKDYKATTMTLGIVNDGAISTGDVYPHPELTGVLYNAYLIKPKYKKVNRQILEYFACVVQKSIKEKFGYDNKASWEKVKNCFISLPITQDETPNFEYMENYIKELEAERLKELEAERLKELEAYLLVSGLNDYELTEEDRKVLSLSTKSTSNENGCNEIIGEDEIVFKKFKIAEIFDIHPTKGYNKASKNIFSDKGKYPVITNTFVKHGVGGYSNLNPTEKNIITFSDTVTNSADSFYYQDNEFIGFSHVQGLYPKSNLWNKYSLHYLITILRVNLQGSYDYSTKMTRKIVSNTLVNLPVDKNGKLNFNFMEKYIRAIEKLTIAKVYEDKTLIIDTTKKIIS